MRRRFLVEQMRRAFCSNDARRRIGPRRQAEFGSARVADIAVGCQRAFGITRTLASIHPIMVKSM